MHQEPTTYTQIIMTGVGVLIAIIIAIAAAIIRFAAQPAHDFSLAWFSAAQFAPQLFATSALTALFFFWG